MNATLGILAAFALTACTSAGGDADPGAPTREPRSSAPTPSATGDPGQPLSQESIEALVRRTATEMGLDSSEIRVVTAEAVTWPDGSLGCPSPGMAYTQALVPGYRVVLDAGDNEVHYHAGRDGRFAPCDSPQEPIATDTVDR